jgi:hypothetical protein
MKKSYATEPTNPAISRVASANVPPSFHTGGTKLVAKVLYWWLASGPYIGVVV